ncbi:DNA-binding transcriptional LysR family regulator [Rhodococcus sp. LBL1]|uniref:DNA-binding transcriptional LysR family regulator n=1 Tax=Prescottella agglutinans TaxID=1644129 RepID=A0ABT6M7P8_9NOCA|nr:LysR family transcriptional regulator [Prescottella agglutinans]MDH6279929.1 DNA-binding transcriptional LysR family regulator [Prescottella agglutinans]MDH6679447.1 DNA-binding transcriptional LysR family regulator [Rhodococcus sp. LBL1]MDH6685414.1 DNA-binding transcriptional LysR family regulator [Rhodococcus sp. LBL2]
MDLHRLRILLELSRWGSMREVADELGMTTSSVSQHIAALTRRIGTPLTEPDGRRVRLTPAGRRLAEHAVTILAAVDAAMLDLDVDAAPVGTVRVAGFASAIRRSLLPTIARLGAAESAVTVMLAEHEPFEALELLARDDVDIALTYDYNLAPAALRSDFTATSLWTMEWGLATHATQRPGPLSTYADSNWIVNSRNTADEEVLRILASMAGFTPRITHHIDSLELIDDLIAAGHGVGLLPLERARQHPDVQVRRVGDFEVILRTYAVIRRGREQWPPLRLVLDELKTQEP